MPFGSTKCSSSIAVFSDGDMRAKRDTVDALLTSHPIMPQEKDKENSLIEGDDHGQLVKSKMSAVGRPLRDAQNQVSVQHCMLQFVERYVVMRDMGQRDEDDETVVWCSTTPNAPQHLSNEREMAIV